MLSLIKGRLMISPALYLSLVMQPRKVEGSLHLFSCPINHDEGEEQEC